MTRRRPDDDEAVAPARPPRIRASEVSFDSDPPRTDSHDHRPPGRPRRGPVPPLRSAASEPHLKPHSEPEYEASGGAGTTVEAPSAEDDTEAEPDEDYVVLPPETGWFRKLGVFLLVLVVLLVGTVGAGAFWVQRQIAPPGGSGDEVVVEIPLDTSTGGIADLLEREDVITNASVFSYYVQVKSAGPFQAGEFTFTERSSMGEVVRVLEAGPQEPPFAQFTVPEGLTVNEITARLADQVDRFPLEEVEAVLTAGEIRSQYQPEGVTTLEGLLFPETYRVEEDEDIVAVVTRMVATMDRTLAELEVTTAQEEFNLTPYEVVIVASLIEEETRIDAERPMVAQVIYNRLRQGIALGIDATSRYEAEIAGRDRGDIDFTSDSPYNTRRQLGLPPTPIAAPSRDSIAAALAPADGPWIYYVLADEEGNHVFTESESEFLDAKEECAARDLGCG